jgi:hypothetical protein
MLTPVYALILAVVGLLNLGSHPVHLTHVHVHANDTGGTMPG